ncbi:hypothetical protein DID75_05000 [Candidatus Marinamargulisbacteria bacterium SCGC AG-410-N11]|nr:hypothetical protein DID75_05000 [Candidatus Marinamargulisbacteria bacterium SCGC AG-410-N11]
MNKAVKEGDNYFYPYALKCCYKTNKAQIETDHDLVNKRNQISNYIQLIISSHVCGQNSAKIRTGLLRYNQRWLNQLSHLLWQDRETLFDTFIDHLYVKNKLDIRSFEKYLSHWHHLANYVESLLERNPDTLNSKSDRLYTLKENKNYVAANIKKNLILFCIYEPWRVSRVFNTLQKANVFDLAPYTIQKAGICTVHNLKAATYSAIGLNSSKTKDFELLKLLNIHLQFTASKLITKFDKNIISATRSEEPAKFKIKPKLVLKGIQTATQYLNNFNVEKAETLFKKLAQKYQNHPIPLLKLAQIYEKKGDAKTALYYYSEAIKRQPNDSTIWNNRGILNARLGHLEDAESDFNQALIINPFNRLAKENMLSLQIKNYLKALYNGRVLLT